jgi:hypothetical protein
MKKDRVSFRHSKEGGKKLKDKLTASCNFHKPRVLTIVRHFAFLLGPHGNNRKLWSGTLEGWGEASEPPLVLV